jgi:hypothetical protein
MPKRKDVGFHASSTQPTRSAIVLLRFFATKSDRRRLMPKAPHHSFGLIFRAFSMTSGSCLKSEGFILRLEDHHSGTKAEA